MDIRKRRMRLIGAVLIIALIGVIAYLVIDNYVENRRDLAKPPNIIIYSPSDGEVIEADSALQAIVTASGISAISRIEMWVDGELVDSLSQELSPGIAGLNFQAYFDLVVPEGTHMIFWRATDQAGLVGQSHAVSVIAQSPDPGETEIVVSEEGQTLGDIADNQNADLGAVSKLNPDLGQEALPPGSQVKVPPKAPPGGQNQPPPGPPPPNASIIPPAPLPATPPGTAAVLPATFPIVTINPIISAILADMPAVPSDLNAGFGDCKIRLVWRDNSDDETHFNVWMQRLGGPRRVIYTLQGSSTTGPAWAEFGAPAFGIYSFWIEAVNGLGGQPSEMKWVAVNDASCKRDALATELIIEAIDMFVGGNYEKTYCYLSLEGSAHRRIPSNENQFIEVLGNWGDVIKHWGGQKRMLMLIPADNEVTLEGECLGKSGASLSVSLGSFSADVPQDQWDGRRLEISGRGFIVGYRIYLHGSSQAHGIYHYTDHSIPQPRVVVVEKEKADDPNDVIEDAILARRPIIRWQWDGNESNLTSFNILLDGKILQWAEPDWRKTRLLLPAGCGQSYQIQVVANAGDAQSVPSPPFVYQTKPCPILAEVQFLSITASRTNDRSCFGFNMVDCFPYSPCDQLSVYGFIWASTPGNYEERWTGSENFHSPFKCNVAYSFISLGADENTIILPIDPLTPDIRFGTRFWEWDSISPNDDWGITFGSTPLLTRDQWASYDNTFTLTAPDPDNTAEGVEVEIRVKGKLFSE